MSAPGHSVRPDATRRAPDAAYETLLSALRQGIFVPGTRLPGERALATQLGLSRGSLRQALQRLADEGELAAAPQRGWFVRTDHVVSEPPSQLQSFTAMGLSRGLTPGSSILEHAVRPATFTESERLAVAPSAEVLEIRRLRTLDDMPICVDHSVIVLSRAPGVQELDLADRSLYEALEREAGVSVVRSDFTVRADTAPGDLAELLNINAGEPVLVGEETDYALDDVPLICGQVTYRADSYRFRATLYRSR